MILTFELEPELEQSLENDAKQKHLSSSEMIKDFLIENYFHQKPASEIVEKNKTISPITQSLIGLLDKSTLDESDYRQHLEDKYL